MLKRVDHVGIVVRDLVDGERWLHEAFGLQVQRRLDLPQGGRAVFYTCGDTLIEMIQVGDPEERRQRLGPDATARIDHIAIEVDDVGATLKRLAPLGVRTTTPEPVTRGGTTSVWTIGDTTGGVSYQFMKKAPAS